VQDGEILRFDAAAMTLMACVEEAIMRQEQDYGQALWQPSAVFRAVRDGARLTLTSQDGLTVLVFEARPA
jgi:heat shock protein HslJ